MQAIDQVLGVYTVGAVMSKSGEARGPDVVKPRYRNVPWAAPADRGSLLRRATLGGGRGGGLGGRLVLAALLGGRGGGRRGLGRLGVGLLRVSCASHFELFVGGRVTVLEGLDVECASGASSGQGRRGWFVAYVAKRTRIYR
jgi:hypothetical protein